MSTVSDIRGPFRLFIPFSKELDKHEKEGSQMRIADLIM